MNATHSIHTMRPIGGPEDSYAYFGDRPDWLIVITVNRDSEALDRSNFRVISRDLTTRFDGDITTERASHWICGWLDKLIVNPSNLDAVAAANEWRLKLEDYPVANEDDYSELESEETESLIEDIRQQVISIGHTPIPEDWDSPNGYRYEHTCGKCGQLIVFTSDNQSYDIPNDCTETG